MQTLVVGTSEILNLMSGIETTEPFSDNRLPEQEEDRNFTWISSPGSECPPGGTHKPGYVRICHGRFVKSRASWLGLSSKHAPATGMCSRPGGRFTKEMCERIIRFREANGQ